MTDYSYYNYGKDKLSSTNYQNPGNWLSWKRVLIGRWWKAFDADDVNRRHACKERQQQETLELWTGI